MSKHTPGPWTVVNENGYWIYGPDDFPIHDSFNADGDEGRAMAIANARLIAAAPELLEACEMALNAMHKLATRLSDMGGYGYPDDLQGGENPATFQALQAAIAKAHGD